MKQFTIFLIIFILLVGGYLFVTRDDADTDQIDDVNLTETQTDDALEEADADSDTSDQDATPSEEEEDGTHHVFEIDSFMYGYSVEEITVAQGDIVTINLTNSEGLHDWVVDEFNAATAQIGAGEETSITFVADQPGTFEYYCSVGNHRAQGMVGTLVVE